MSDTEISSPIVSYRGRVLPEWIDWNGHMNVAYYVLAFDLATDNLFDELGIGKAYREHSGCSSFTLELHVNYLREIKQDEEFEVRSYILGVDTKRLHVFHDMIHAESGEQVATNENMLAHIDMGKRRSSPFPDHLREKMQAIADAHKTLERPANAGRSIGF
jgi:acyl-CoA thioester hydrolase